MVELVKRVSSVAIVEPVTAEEPVAASEPAAAVAMTGDPETDARAWIEAVLGEPLGDETLHLVLKSGVVLCNLLNKISPGCCKKPTMKKLPFMQMENVSNYLTACNTTFKIQRELRVLHDGRPIRGQEHERGRAQHPCARTRHAVAKVHRDHARYRALDGPLTHQAATAGAPQRTADLTAFETVVFDADKSGTAAIDLVFRGAPTIQSMAQASSVLPSRPYASCARRSRSTARTSCFLPPLPPTQYPPQRACWRTLGVRMGRTKTVPYAS